MGSILSDQKSTENDKNNDDNIKMSKNWQVLQKTLYKQILKSNKTSLIVQRYWFEMQNYEDFQSQNKIFQWRNQNPNSQFMVNVLSVCKDQLNSQQSLCGSIDWCPSQKIMKKIYVVTQRILKLSQFKELFQKQKQSVLENNKSHIVYATDQKQLNKANNQYKLKNQPFINIKFSQKLVRQLFKDWIRGIQVLCYKFGYFKIYQNNLGVTAQKRGIVWIDSNYALNHINPENKIQVTTAQQKFKFQKQTIQKIITFTQNIKCFKSLVKIIKQRNIIRFDQFSNFLDQLNKPKPIQAKKLSPLPQRINPNTSLYVQHGSFLAPHNFIGHNNSLLHNNSVLHNNSLLHSNSLLHNNSSFFVFNQNNALKRVNSNPKIKFNQNVVSLQASLKKQKQIKSINSANNINSQKQGKRSNTGQKFVKNYSPQNKQQMLCINSNHKFGGKQTAPTNQLGHSSSLHSVNQPSNMRCNFQQINKNRNEGKTLFKSQNHTKLKQQNINQNNIKPISNPSNKVYIHHKPKNQHTSEPYIFRSQANQIKSKSPRPHQNMSFNYQGLKSPKQKYHNYSLDQNNIIGPYRKDKYYSNIKKQKIELVDSMVMVKQQSQQNEQNLHTLSRSKYILQESIIIMGKEQDEIIQINQNK